jgi:hypothetical protein
VLRYFMLGLVDASEPDKLSRELGELRIRLMADPYFRKVPSMQPEAKKTALAFHAKDDVPEVRREVLALILRHDLQFLAIVRDKRKVIEYVRQRNEQDSVYRYTPNELYDYMVRRLFKNLLHKDDEYNIYFARRGASDRTGALQKALEAARRRFSTQWNIVSTALINVIPGSPANHAGLQVADYFLWRVLQNSGRGVSSGVCPSGVWSLGVTFCVCSALFIRSTGHQADCDKAQVKRVVMRRMTSAASV